MGLYVYSTFLIGIALIAGFCFVAGWAYNYIAAVGQHTAISLGVYDSQEQGASSFLSYFFEYLGIFCLIVLGVWAIVYQQKQGQGNVFSGEA